MVSASPEIPVTDLRLSSVVPASVTGEDKVHELTEVDLAMKLHYVRGVYFFAKVAAEGLEIYDLKKPMADWLQLWYPTSGRVRRSSDDGRPVIKCNDSGVRIVEAQCEKTVEEWLALNDHSLSDDLLLYNDHVLGPDLGFSPLVFIQHPFNLPTAAFQFTWFKCGGISVGLSWAHVLGDAISASHFINMWGRILAGEAPPQSLTSPPKQFPPSISERPFSVRMVDPVGDSWQTTTDSKMKIHSFSVTSKQLHHLVSQISGPNREAESRPFEILSAVIWKSLAKIKDSTEPRVVTVCRSDFRDRENEIPSNSQVISTVEANFPVAEAGVSELAKLIREKAVDERSLIEEMMNKENENLDLIVYGANLTFVSLEETNVYALELRRQKPVFAYYSIGGVGEEGAVFILPGPKESGDDGRIVTLIMAEHLLVELKNELEKEWNGFF